MEENRYSSDGLIHDKERLKELQSLPLERKIGITQARIIEWYNHFNGNVYVSFSGGKDSTVLYDIVHKLFPDVPAVYSNTGLEYPEIKAFAENICSDIVKPQISFVEVIKRYGYPLISKEVSEAIYYARRNPRERERERDRMETTGTHRKQTSVQPKSILLTTTWKRLELMSFRKMFGERCLWVASTVPMALRNLLTIKTSGCL